MRIHLLLLPLLFIGSALKGQVDNTWLQWQEQRLKVLGLESVDCREPEDRKESLRLFHGYLHEALAEAGSFNYPFDSVKTMRVLNSPDKEFRIITWTLMHERDSYEFFGCIQFADPEKEVVWLHDSSHRYIKEEPLYENLDADNWYGALYYQLVLCKHKKQKYYLLLGWDGNTKTTDKKIIEVLSFSEEGEPAFGKPVFTMAEDKAPQYRAVYEFQNSAVMALRHEPKKNIVVIEHLAPPSPNATGIYRLYLPDGTYDYLTYKKGMWKLNTMLFDTMGGATED